jgi:8-oxo-dGTP pyrophosphatase MutT (NUDIX family)
LDEDYSDLSSDEIPQLVPAGALDLATLGGPAAELSTGLVLSWRGKLVFGLDPRARPLGSRRGSGALAFVGVGGHLEPGEGWRQAVCREAQEEARCGVGLADSPVTYLCREGQAPRPIAFRWDEPQRPLLVWIAEFELPRGPQRLLTRVTFVNAVFRAAALSAPSPAAEMKALLLIDHETLLAAYRVPQTVEALLALGARFIGEQPPAGTLLAPGGTAYFLAQWLAWQEQRIRLNAKPEFRTLTSE